MRDYTYCEKQYKRLAPEENLDNSRQVMNINVYESITDGICILALSNFHALSGLQVRSHKLH